MEGPDVMCEGMELVANSVQGFGGWGRRVSSAPLFANSEIFMLWCLLAVDYDQKGDKGDVPFTFRYKPRIGCG